MANTLQTRQAQGYVAVRTPQVVDLRQAVAYVAVQDPPVETLFHASGIVIEKEAPKIDAFHLQGIVIDKAPGVVDVATTRVRVAKKGISTVDLKTIRVRVAKTADGFVNLPSGIAGIDRVKALIQAKAKSAITWTQFDLSAPVPQPGSANPVMTAVSFTAKESSTYRGTVQLVYRRRSIGALGPLKLAPANYATIADVIAAIRAKGYLIDATDVDVAASTITADRITMYAKAGSYFFYPGSKVIFGSAVDFAAQFTTDQMDGFDPVSA